MTDDTLSPADLLFHAISSINPWGRPLMSARNFSSSGVSQALGGLISSLLLATEEGESAVAVTGNWTGEAEWLAIVTNDGLVHGRLTVADDGHPDFTVKCYSFADVSELTLHAGENYFDNLDARHHLMSFAVRVGDVDVTFGPTYRTNVPLLGDDDLLAAFKAIRAGRP